MGNITKKKTVTTVKKPVVDYKKDFPTMVPTPKDTKSTFGKDLNKLIDKAGGVESFNAKLPTPKGIRQFKKQDGSYFSETDKNKKDYQTS